MARTTATSSTASADAAKPDGQTARTGRQTAADLAFCARAMKAPALLDAAERLAERAHAESWTHLDTWSPVSSARSPPATATAARAASARPGFPRSRPSRSWISPICVV